MKYVIGTAFTVTFIFVSSFYLSPHNVDSGVANEPVLSKGISQHDTQTPQSAGRVAYIGSDTGALSSTPPASAQRNASIGATVNLPPVEMVKHSSGVVQAKLNGRFRTPLVATIGCDGKINMEHTQNPVESELDCEAE